MATRPLTVAFVHPDLGIGGAERLVVDAATGLQRCGHAVVVYTSHHDRTHCFEETRDGTLDVRVRGDFLPRSVFGAAFIFCAILRGLYLAATIVLFEPHVDVIVVDQLSASIPVLRMTGSKIVFYCHFPDKMLAARTSLIKRIYRVPFDFLEEITTMMADEIVVNSRFTAQVFASAFKHIRHTPEVLYPGIHLDSYSKRPDLSQESVKQLTSSKTTILSINRFERKKNLGLAVRAFVLLKEKAPKEFKNLRLVMAGGYDKRVAENVEHLHELESLAHELGLSTHIVSPGSSIATPDSAQIVFVLSFDENQRTYMLSTARCLVYTPSEEHFGIVPIEAMYARVPVVAVASGGPTETVVNGETGFLCDADPHLFAQAIASIVGGSAAAEMGEAGRRRVLSQFTHDAFTQSLERLLMRAMKSESSHGYLFAFVLVAIASAIIIYRF